jgi:hypothetical protein
VNYYEILGIEITASKDEITQTFRKLAKEYHPDLNKNKDAKTIFINVYEAYSILKDDKKREIYNNLNFNQNTKQNVKKERAENYYNWKEAARSEAEYYSKTNYKEFSDKVLKKIIIIAKFTKTIIGFFILLIICGIVSIIITNIINYSISTALENSNENQENNNILPLDIDDVKNDWKRLFIQDLGSIDIPPTMEVLSGKYKEIVTEVKDVMKIDASNIIIHQKGLNEFEESSFQKYARVLIDTEIGQDKQFESLTFNINYFSAKDIEELEKIFLMGIEDSIKNTDIKIKEWFPLKLETINGMSSLHFRYIRQLRNNPLVHVEIFIFFNNDRFHRLTLSYRLSEEEYWKDDLNNILNSFRITNIR